MRGDGIQHRMPAQREITVAPDRFEVAAFSRESLLNGYDEIELSLLQKDKIEAYEKSKHAEHPWL